METGLIQMKESEVFGHLLQKVSRSFYLTLNVLPKKVRMPIGLAYLLARTSDTIADSLSSPVAERLKALGELKEALNKPRRLDFLSFFSSDPAETRLMGITNEILTLFHGCDPIDQSSISRTIHIIISGQEMDLQRFG
jgi:farnesyl-diphosphate farnesyltransferase